MKTTNTNKLRKTSAMLTSLLMVAVSANTIVISAAADNTAPSVDLEIGSATAQAGETVDIDVMVKGNDFSYFGTQLQYDSGLSFDGYDISQGSVKKVGGTMEVDELEDDTVMLAGFASRTNPAKEGTLVTLHFTVPRTAKNGSIYNIQWIDVNEFGNDVEYNPGLIDGQIVVQSDYELKYKVVNGEATVTGVDIAEGADISTIRIPETYNDAPVTSIAKGAFKNISGVESVEIPSSVTDIDSNAFGSADTGVEIKASEGSAAEKYAEKMGFTMVAQGEAASSDYRIDVDDYKLEFTDSAEFSKDNIHVVKLGEGGKETLVTNWTFATTPEEEYSNGVKKVKVTIEADGQILGSVSLDIAVKGNVTDSGKLSASDVSSIFSAFKKEFKTGETGFNARQSAIADFNSDGKISAADASMAFSQFKANYKKGK